MLTAIGPGVASLQDYTEFIPIDSLSIQNIQGDAQDTAACTVWDAASTFTITDEDDIVMLDEADPNGWPGVNLLTNQSFEGTYSSGIAPNWAANQTGTGITYSSSATALYGSAAQQIQLANATNGAQPGLTQSVPLPQNEYAAILQALPYYFSCYLKVTGAFSGCSGSVISIAWYDVANVLISTVSTSLDSVLGSAGGWVRVFCSGKAPGNAYTAKVQVLVNVTNATNAGTVLLDGAQFEYATFGNVWINPLQTALQGGKYPTPYIDPQQPGCYVETGLSNLAYRHLRRFGGLIRIAEADYVGPARNIQISAVDYGVLLSEAPATLVILQTSDYNAIQQAFTYAKNQGFLVGIDSTTYVQTIGIVDAHAYSWKTTRDVLTQVANENVAAYWVDYYGFLHYVPALAVSAPFALSDHPDFAASFPFYEFQDVLDSTNTRTSPVYEGSTQLSNPITQVQSGDGTTTTFTFNGGDPIQQIDNLTVGGVQQTIGLANVNSFSQGYTALLNTPNGQITFQTAPPAGTNNISCTYRFASPVIIRVHLPTASSPQGHRNRKIHYHQKIGTITSQRSAIDRANADLSFYHKARSAPKCVVYSPPAPAAVPLRVGTAIAITHTPSGYTGQLFQIQEVDTYPLGNGVYRYELQLGFYRPNFAIQDAQLQQDANGTADQIGDGVLSDVLTVYDSWQFADAPIKITPDTVGKWGPTTSSTWSGTFVWT
jgi:hypothetical protein